MLFGDLSSPHDGHLGSGLPNDHTDATHTNLYTTAPAEDVSVGAYIEKGTHNKFLKIAHSLHVVAMSVHSHLNLTAYMAFFVDVKIFFLDCNISGALRNRLRNCNADATVLKHLLDRDMGAIEFRLALKADDNSFVARAKGNGHGR